LRTSRRTFSRSSARTAASHSGEPLAGRWRRFSWSRYASASGCVHWLAKRASAWTQARCFRSRATAMRSSHLGSVSLTSAPHPLETGCQEPGLTCQTLVPLTLLPGLSGDRDQLLAAVGCVQELQPVLIPDQLVVQ